MIQKQTPLDFQWPTQEPFLFCVHHHDFYPAGTETYGPNKSLLEGRPLGHDFTTKDGFRMYHGQEVPGFPMHPHRGFETITIVRKGYVDHADSLGAAGRYGEGDVQWMTAGQGVQHSEMFPLLKKDEPNTLELFQIWLNLPGKSKRKPAHFKMFWSGNIPRIALDDGKVQINLIAGELHGHKGLPPPPNSWASAPDHEVTVALISMESGGTLNLSSSTGLTNRSLYFFAGEQLTINGQDITAGTGLQVDSSAPLQLYSPSGSVEILLLQGKAIGEPISQHGPFVMNSREEIVQTFEDYQRTQFGGWPWPRHDMVHGPDIERFARHPDGRMERPGNT